MKPYNISRRPARSSGPFVSPGSELEHISGPTGLIMSQVNEKFGHFIVEKSGLPDSRTAEEALDKLGFISGYVMRAGGQQIPHERLRKAVNAAILETLAGLERHGISVVVFAA